MDSVSVNGITLRYDESGRGEPLILLHGFNADRHQFDILRPLLGEGIRAITYDQRDSPDSPFDRAYSMVDHASDAAGVIESLCGGSAHVFGTSYGGAIAMTLAALHPDRVKRLVLATTAATGSEFRPPDVSSMAGREASEVRRFVLEHFFTPYAIDHDAELMQAARDATKGRDPASLDRRRQALISHDARPLLERIVAPTLVLHGAEDPIVTRRVSERLVAAIPGAELTIVEGVRHAISLEGRHKTAEVLRAFTAQPR